jgi:hypothetical protein
MSAQDHRRAGGERREQPVQRLGQPGRVDQDPVASGDAQLGGPLAGRLDEFGLRLEGYGWSEAVAVAAYLGDEVQVPVRHRAQGETERMQTYEVTITLSEICGMFRRTETNLGRTGDGGHVDPGRPAAEQHPGGLPVRRKQGHGPVTGIQSHPVDQQVRRFGDPVGERRAGQFGALSAAVVVPRQQRSGRIHRDRRGEQRAYRRHVADLSQCLTAAPRRGPGMAEIWGDGYPTVALRSLRRAVAGVGLRA